ncbi:MAG: hypothetical protein KKB70_07035, partial [Proteobacteria bacterium]|nr:hypothetical protein [Pseudomonadota bacterium]
CFVPLRSPDTIRVTDIIRAIRGDKEDTPEMRGRFGFLNGVFDDLSNAAYTSEANATLLEYASRFEANEMCGSDA